MNSVLKVAKYTIDGMIYPNIDADMHPENSH
jgi:hypothetical protein